MMILVIPKSLPNVVECLCDFSLSAWKEMQKGEIGRELEFFFVGFDLLYSIEFSVKA